jgi:TonB family protein
MKKSIVACVFWLCSLAQAEEMKLVYEKQPKAIYPSALYMAGISGVVRIAFNAHHDGSVTDIQVLHSSYREFAKAAANAVSRWRLKPWDPGNGRPQVVPVQIDLYFTAKGDPRQLMARLRSRVRSLPCATLNKEVERSPPDLPNQGFSGIRTFHHTQQLLARKVRKQGMSFDESAAVFDQFERVKPEIVRLCKERPDARYIDLLPEALKDML